MCPRGANREAGPAPHADDLVARARAAADGERWMESLDLASQALAADPRRDDAAALVGIARNRLGTLHATGTELRQLTVVAVDMCGSTAIAAAVGPERYRQLMLELYEACVEAFARFEGRVTKYVGDGVLGQFGHPVAHEDDARRATLAALALLEGVEDRNVAWRERFGTEIEIRIGLDSGTVAIGPMDASPWSPDEIAGDPPNVASRVQASADPMTVLVTDATYRLIAGWFETEPVGDVTLRNYPREVALHRVLAPTEAESRLEASVRQRPALVGREAELERLRTAIAEVRDVGERRVVGLVGAPGIGKSRLAEHVLATAVAAGATSLTVTCSHLQRDSPLRPIARTLGRLLRLQPRDAMTDAAATEAIRAALLELPNRRTPTDEAVALYAWLLARAPVPEMEPDVLRRRAFEAVIDLLETLAATAMLVLYVDDVDAADPSTIELLAALVGRPRAVRMLVVLTGRGPLPPELDLDVELELTGLPADDAAALARGVAPTLDGTTVRRIVARCDGVPFYIEELAIAAEDTDDDVRPEPAELSAFVAARLDELGAPLRRLVGQLAVAGREARLDVLARLSELTSSALAEQVSELSARGIVRRSRTPQGEVVRFRHDVMREVAYRTILESRRAELHGRLAGILAELPAHTVPPEDLAAHCARAGDHADAASRWVEAARAAIANGANREATRLFGHALASIAQLPESPARAAAELEAQLGLGNARSTLHGYTSPHAREAFERAMDLAESLADSTALFPAIWGMWSYWFVLGEHGIATTLAERLVAIADDRPDDPRYRWVAATIVGYQHLYMGDFAAARDELELASRHVGVEPVADFPHDMGIVGQAALSVALLFLGEYEESARVAGLTATQAEALDPTTRKDALTKCWVANWLAWRAELAGDSETALAHAERATAMGVDQGYATWLAAAALHKSIAQCSLGRYEEGLPMLAAVVDAWRAAGQDADGAQRHPVLMTPYYAGRLAAALMATGEREAAARLVDELLAATAANGEHFWDAELQRLQAALNDRETTT